MANLALQGKTYEEFLRIFNGDNIRTIDDFKNALNGLNEEVKEGTDEAGGGSNSAINIEDMWQNVSSSISNVSKIESMINSLNSGKQISISDILG